MWRRAFATALLLALGAGVTACDSDSVTGVVVPAYRGEPNGDDAALPATVQIEGRCLFVEDEAGDRLLIAFPASAVDWDDQSGELRLGGETYRHGDRVQFGGSAHPTSKVRESLRWETPPLEACMADWIWVSQADARLVVAGE